MRYRQIVCHLACAMLLAISGCATTNSGVDATTDSPATTADNDGVDTGATTAVEQKAAAEAFTEDGPVVGDPGVDADGFLLVSQTHPYYFKAPVNYNSNKTRPYPLVVYLHQAGGDAVYLYCLSSEFRQIKRNLHDSADAFVCVPRDHDWPSLTAIISDLRARFNIDTTRLYLAGFSMGGSASYTFASYFYQQTGLPFAAISRNAGMSDYTSAQYQDIAKSVAWIHVGSADATPVSKASSSWDAQKAIFLPMGAVEDSTIYASPLEAIAQGLAQGTYLPNLKDYSASRGIMAKVKTLTLSGKIVARLSIYRGFGHEELMFYNIGYLEWIFSQQVIPQSTGVLRR